MVISLFIIKIFHVIYEFGIRRRRSFDYRRKMPLYGMYVKT